MAFRAFSGGCVCGHDFDDHHHGIIVRPDLMVARGDDFRNVDGVLGEECEATQFEGRFTPDVKIHHADGRVEHRHHDKMCECSSYWDTKWGERP